jgi:two-component system response regulator NreC
MTLIRVLLSTDYPMMRDGLRILLNASGRYEVCGEAADGRQTLQLAMQLNPDILILDISMPPPTGLEVVGALRRMLPNIKILVITMHDSEEILRDAVAAGAAGYLLKSDGSRSVQVGCSRFSRCCHLFGDLGFRPCG